MPFVTIRDCFLIFCEHCKVENGKKYKCILFSIFIFNLKCFNNCLCNHFITEIHFCPDQNNFIIKSQGLKYNKHFIRYEVKKNKFQPNFYTLAVEFALPKQLLI